MPQQRGSITLPVKGNGTDLMSLAALMIAAPADAQATRKARAVRKPAAPAVPAAFRFADWAPYRQVRKYTKKNVADRLDGSAELFLQYGLTDLTVHRFRPAVQTKNTAGKGIALEICRTETFADAFGIFQVRRFGRERLPASCLRILDQLEELKDAEIDED